jgi:hypothetical protein
MNLSKHFQSNANNQLMDTQNIVGSTTAASGDDNNNLPIQRSNGNNITPAYEGNYQVDVSSTNFELETITSSYIGLIRIYRLLYIAEHCPILRHEAFLASLKYIQETHFISLYKQVRLNVFFLFDFNSCIVFRYLMKLKNKIYHYQMILMQHGTNEHNGIMFINLKNLILIYEIFVQIQ